MIIKKEYSGLVFSAYVQSLVLQKLAGISGILAITVGVPNSLGPGELLQHYGTKQQKDHYLPRLAHGQEILCFALTSAKAGSDAGTIPDSGVVCMGEWPASENPDGGSGNCRRNCFAPRTMPARRKTTPMAATNWLRMKNSLSVECTQCHRDRFISFCAPALPGTERRRCLRAFLAERITGL
ncbi:hypothetical protein SY86_22645 [Erwinia tracheiphila]|uniref:Acyl-CoA dehydrogenase/oxidase N-terminal domain-containing protein n=1 Tax=Erwinia tracheiphila TaxID=65700 RepID=A0A0M2KF60_9GAMM|nr:acyl-CoA dehydrogenase [Erwinia tracheiphila PSU-1]KKF37559.1 hypothetical protein SY86_22645 [Erwinia tracheiphila]